MICLAAFAVTTALAREPDRFQITYKGGDDHNNTYEYTDTHTGQIVWSRSLPIDVHSSTRTANGLVCLGTNVAQRNNIKCGECSPIVAIIIPDDRDDRFHIHHVDRHSNLALSGDSDEDLCDPRVIDVTEIGQRIVVTLDVGTTTNEYLWHTFDCDYKPLRVEEGTVKPYHPAVADTSRCVLRSVDSVGDATAVMCWTIYDRADNLLSTWHMLCVVDRAGQICWYMAIEGSSVNTARVQHSPRYGVPINIESSIHVETNGSEFSVILDEYASTFEVVRRGDRLYVLNKSH